MTLLSHEPLECAPRIMRREWKRYKPYLPKSTSLPTLQLTPSDRPLFTCRKCGFTNTSIPLCLWCSWTSTAAKVEFESCTPRGRRASAPPRVFGQASPLRDQLRLSQASVASAPHPASLCRRHFSAGKSAIFSLKTDHHDTSISCLEEYAQGGEGAVVRQGSSQGCNIPDDRVVEPTVADGDAVVTTATASHIHVKSRFRSQEDLHRNESAEGQSPTRFRRPRPIPALFLTTSHHNHKPTSTTHGVDRSSIMTKTKLSMKSSRSLSSHAAHIVLDLKRNTTSITDIIVPSSPILGPPADRTIRRKKGMSFLRQPSSSSLRARARASAPPCPRSSDPLSMSVLQRPQSCTSEIGTLPANSSFSHSHSHSQPSVRLGHPSRPYYTAIRKNMSRPNSPSEHDSRPSSPFTSHSRSSSPSPALIRVPQPSFLDTDPDGENYFTAPLPPSSRPTSEAYSHPFGFTSPISGIRSGFSLSGETELKMLLAKGKDADPGEYRYRYVEKLSVRGRVKKLGQGLKDLMRRRS